MRDDYDDMMATRRPNDDDDDVQTKFQAVTGVARRSSYGIAYITLIDDAISSVLVRLRRDCVSNKGASRSCDSMVGPRVPSSDEYARYVVHGYGRERVDPVLATEKRSLG